MHATILNSVVQLKNFIKLEFMANYTELEVHVFCLFKD